MQGRRFLAESGEMNMQFEFSLHKIGLHFEPNCGLLALKDPFCQKFWTLLPLYGSIVEESISIYDLRIAQENLTFKTSLKIVLYKSV